MEGGMIYGLIGQAMNEIGAIGKDSRNQQQGFMYRGIDAVYNALNPVMAKLGLFITPEILDHKRDERVTIKYDSQGNEKKSSLFYSIITVKYTVFAPDGSNISLTVIGEGMDSGDKATNKAMSVAMKYAMFQLFMIPTEELKDPDSETHDNIQPRGNGANVSTMDKVPEPEAPPETPADYLKRMISEMVQNIPKFNFVEARRALIDAKKVEDVPSATIKMDQARKLVDEMYAYYGVKKAG